MAKEYLDKTGLNALWSLIKTAINQLVEDTANHLNKDGDTMEGDINMNDNDITHVEALYIGSLHTKNDNNEISVENNLELNGDNLTNVGTISAYGDGVIFDGGIDTSKTGFYVNGEQGTDEQLVQGDGKFRTIQTELEDGILNSNEIPTGNAVRDYVKEYARLNSAAKTHTHSISDVTNLQATLNPLLVENFGKVRLMFIEKEAYIVAEDGYLNNNDYIAYLFRWTKSTYRYRNGMTTKRSKHIGWIAPQKGGDKITFSISCTNPDSDESERTFRIFIRTRVGNYIRAFSLLTYLTYIQVTGQGSKNFYIADRRCALRIWDVNNECWVSDYLPFMVKYNANTEEMGIGRWHK